MGDLSIKAVLISAVAALGLSITLVPTMKAATPGDEDVLTQLLGGTREIASKAAFTEADVYFHGGVSGGCPHDEDGCTEENEKAKPSRSSSLPLASIVEEIQGETAPRQHAHLSAAHQKELLPWFVAAARLNPHSIEAWSTGAYWYYKTGDTHRAVDFLGEAIQANPGVYQLYLERGILMHRLSRWSDAVNDLQVAERMWKGKSEDDRLNKKAIGIYMKDAEEHLRVAKS